MTPASYTASIRLNGVTTDGRCHHCGADVKLQHGAEPTNPAGHRHYFKCEACGEVGLLYPLEYTCEGCSQASSEGGAVIVYTMPEPTCTLTDDEIQALLWPGMTTAVQMRMEL